MRSHSGKGSPANCSIWGLGKYSTRSTSNLHTVSGIRKESAVKKGKVYLVGAGPGDPGLLTLRGKQVLERAEVVIFDYLANEELLKFAPPWAERIYVGKKGGDHTLGQEAINALLVEKGREN